jgi:hypothetical protein
VYCFVYVDLFTLQIHGFWFHMVVVHFLWSIWCFLNGYFTKMHSSRDFYTCCFLLFFSKMLLSVSSII